MPGRLLPERMFELGNEPVDKKVNIYYQLNFLEVIEYALEDDLLRKLKNSQFGKLIEVGNKIASSVRFLHFLLSRQLVTKKRHEIWCLFAGQPIRFSIREFALATGLKCSKLPTQEVGGGSHSEIINYTKTLFGEEKNPTPLWIMNTLLGKPYKDKDTRLRLACLLLVDGVLCPTSKKAKINWEHILMVKDVDAFLAYPWGRKSFDMTMDCIKGKSRSSSLSNLCQPSCALQGFAHALQMVVLACAPIIMAKEVKGKSAAYNLVDEEVDEVPEEVPFLILRPGGTQKPISISMPYVKSLDKEYKVDVKHIMEEDDNVIVGKELSWSDEEEDARVDHMFELINCGDVFTRKLWIGGAKAIDHIKPTKVQTTTEGNASTDVNAEVPVDSSASTFYQKIVDANAELLKNFAILTKAFIQLQTGIDEKLTQLQTNIDSKLSNFAIEIRNLKHVDNRPCDLTPTMEQSPLKDTRSHSATPSKQNASGIDNISKDDAHVEETNPNDISSDVLSQVPCSENDVNQSADTVSLGWSLGITQEQKKESQCSNIPSNPPVVNKACNLNRLVRWKNSLPRLASTAITDRATQPKRIKRTHKTEEISKIFPKLNAEEITFFESKMKANRKFPALNGIVLSDTNFKEIASTTQPLSMLAMDSIITYIREHLRKKMETTKTESFDFLESSFVSVIANLHPNVADMKKNAFSMVGGYVNSRRPWYKEITKLYCPYLLENKHWVGLCISLELHEITVLDCYQSLFKEQKVKTLIEPLAESLPHIIRKVASSEEMKTATLEPFRISVAKPIWQTEKPGLSGITSLMLLELHASVNMSLNVFLTESLVHNAALKYAFDLLMAIEPPLCI